MGDRGQIFIKDNKVYLYTHWDASRLVELVEKAIKRKQRWDDPDYLTRIIFDTMTEKNHGEETGYGIGTELAGDIWRLVTVDCENQTVAVKDKNYPEETKTFEEIAGV